MQERKLRLGFAFFPYGGVGASSLEYPGIRSWFARTVLAIQKDPRCEFPVWSKDFSDTPITMTRNLACREAQKAGVDVLVMCDSDSHPDLYLDRLPEAKPFFSSSFDFLYRRFDQGPCLVFAPYCGPPPNPVTGGAENVYVFHWDLNRNHWEKGRKSLEQFSRHEAAICQGMMEVAAGPTGLIMIDMRALEHPGVPKPWFEYEWEDPPYNTRKASTEDVYFTRNCSMAGVPNFCNWDAWVGHVKPEIVGKPWRPSVEDYRKEFVAQARSAGERNERRIDLKAGMSDEEIMKNLGRAAEAIIRGGPAEDDDEIPGWCDFQDIYRAQVELAQDGAHFVEVGGFMGKSAAIMAEFIKRSGKNIQFDVIDPWESMSVLPHLGPEDSRKLPFKKDILPLFLSYLEKKGVADRVRAVKGTSELAVRRYSDESLDFVFIDGDHRYEFITRDIQNFWAKVKPGGTMAGHDLGYADVERAVREFSERTDLSYGVQGDSYIFFKPIDEDLPPEKRPDLSMLNPEGRPTQRPDLSMLPERFRKQPSVVIRNIHEFVGGNEEEAPCPTT